MDAFLAGVVQLPQPVDEESEAIILGAAFGPVEVEQGIPRRSGKQRHRQKCFVLHQPPKLLHPRGAESLAAAAVE